jgi:muconolactone D-isomerase
VTVLRSPRLPRLGGRGSAAQGGSTIKPFPEVSAVDFLVEFEINVPEGTPENEVTKRQDAESAAAAKLADQGHLLRLWKRDVAPGESRPIGLYRAESKSELDGLLGALPLSAWMRITVTPLESHPNDPASDPPPDPPKHS